MAAFDLVHDELFDRYKAASVRYQELKARRDQLAESPPTGAPHDTAFDRATLALQLAAVELATARDAFLNGDW